MLNAIVVPRERSFCLAERSSGELAYASVVADLVFDALVCEVELSPKPGLVDRLSNGAHRDMTLASFHASATALRPWFGVFYRIGVENRLVPPAEFLAHLRLEGMAAERAMFAATAGVNTHKGAIFCLGLVCAAIGRLGAAQADLSSICDEVAQLCAGIVGRELGRTVEAMTAGERLFQQHGLTGARGEAASGFATVRLHALPVLQASLAAGFSDELALHATLLSLLAHNQDTNLVARGGMAGLVFVQQWASVQQARGGVAVAGYFDEVRRFDNACIERNLSPGGSADLLALSWFLYGWQKWRR